MLLFALWSVLALGALTAAGYSHYRYRVVHNQYYEHLFARNRTERADAEVERSVRCRCAASVLALAVVGLLVPMSLVI
jgi:hypothetical protein